MNILLLSTNPGSIMSVLETDKDNVLITEQPICIEHLKDRSIDFVVSYRYRHIVKRDVLDYMKNRIVNLHISFLPWNRGADPNLWSFLENTPKGVSVHFMDAGIDTGDIIVQELVDFELERETLATSYEKLNQHLIELFSRYWPHIAKCEIVGKKQPHGGTVHRVADKCRFNYLLEGKGWKTPVRELIGKALEFENTREGTHHEL